MPPSGKFLPPGVTANSSSNNLFSQPGTLPMSKNNIH